MSEGRDPSTLMEMAGAYRLSQAVHALAALGVPDLLSRGPAPATELAHGCGADPESLRRLLRALASEGVLLELADGRFELTPFSQQLRSDVSGSARAMVLGWTALDEAYQAFGNLLPNIRTGTAGFKLRYGSGFYEYHRVHPDRARVYIDAVESTEDSFEDVVAGHDWGRYQRIVDVGGEEGSLLIAILRRYPDLTGVVFDLPEVVAGARARIDASEVAERITLCGGNGMESVPAGGDAYVLATVLRTMTDEGAGRLLANCSEAMTPGARLLVIEEIIPEGPARRPGGMRDLTAMVVYGGRERTEREFARLFERAGLHYLSSRPFFQPFSLLEAEKEVRSPPSFGGTLGPPE